VELRIVTAPEALALLEEGWPTKALSLVGDDLRFPLGSFGPHHLVLRFHDVEAEVEGLVAPTVKQLRQALAHTKDLRPDERLLVHCHAGKSRRPAMALGILVQAGMSPSAALEHVRTVRPELIPNRLMIRQLDRLLDLQGELVAVVDAHYRSLGPDALLPDRGGLNL
jgi:predicted protein tyrosine phosphatase